MIPDVRKNELINWARVIFQGIPNGVIGNKSLAQLTLNRILSVTCKKDEVAYMTDCISELIKRTKGKEVEIHSNKKGIIHPDAFKNRKS